MEMQNCASQDLQRNAKAALHGDSVPLTGSLMNPLLCERRL